MKPLPMACTLIAFTVGMTLVLMSFSRRAERRGASAERTSIATEYFRAGVASAVMVKARGLDSNVVTYDDFLAACQKAWVTANTNDVGVIK